MASTMLTLFTGMRENSVVVYVSGRYDTIRYRLQNGFINYKHIRDDLLNITRLPNLKQVGKDWRIFASPTRSPLNVGQDRSVCPRINSMNATVLTMNFNDFWGRGVRREQLYLFSISAPNCKVITFEPSWVTDNCTALHDNDPSKCHRYILDNFDELYEDRPIQVGVEVDFGAPGSPFLKCLGRPYQTFEFMADLIVQQQYWAGGSHVVEVQSSHCYAEPLIRNPDWRWGLFKVVEMNQEATVITAVDQTSFVSAFVTYAYGLVSIFLIVNGVLRIVSPSKEVWYIPMAKRFLKDRFLLRYLFPSMRMLAILPSDEDTVVVFKGARVIGSDFWMNHWLYIYMSIAEALVSMRIMYVCLEMGTWLLSNKSNFSNFAFICSALTRITWLMCLVHTCLRYLLKFFGLVLKLLGLLSERKRVALDNFVDGASCFLSYKIYSVTLCLILLGFLKFHGGTTFQKPDPPYKRASLGGNSDVKQFWGTEIVCDLFVIFCFHTACGIIIAVLLMLTPYRHCVNSAVIRLVQKRYFLVGWDVFVVMDVLGMNPFDPDLVQDGIALTDCSFGCVLQVLCAAGPSGFLHFAGDPIFSEQGKGPVLLHYAPKRATAMGLFEAHLKSQFSVCPMSESTSSAPTSPSNRELSEAFAKEEKRGAKKSVPRPTVSPKKAAKTLLRTSIFDSTLRIVSESAWGRLLVVNATNPGRFQRNSSGTMNEFVAEDALSGMDNLDLRTFLGTQKHMHFT